MASKKADKEDKSKKADPALTAFQIEVETEIQWRSLLRREGLIVIDVYTSWAGPCVSMINILKRIKVEVNDDRLWYALACSDTIDDLLMFKDQSEPCWLFMGGGKPVRVVRGSRVPKLNEAIRTEFEHEVQCIEGKARRNLITIDDDVSKRRKAEAEAARLHEMIVEIDAADSLNEIRRESSTTLIGNLVPFTCVLIQPFLVEAGNADEIKDYLSGDFKIVQEVHITMTEDLARHVYRIPYEIPIPVDESEEEEFTMAPPPNDDDADPDDATSVKTVKKPKKPKKKTTQPVQLPEGILGDTVALLMMNEEINDLHEQGLSAPSDLLATADDIVRVKVGPVKFKEAQKHAPTSLHASYGKEDAPGVWCPRMYDDKRFVILNFFQDWVGEMVEQKAPEPKKYTLCIFPVSSTVAINDNEAVKNNSRDVVIMQKMKVPEELIEPFLKSGPISDGDFMMKKAALSGQDVMVVSINSKNTELKNAIVALDPIYVSANDQNGRIQTSKLFPQLKISLEERADPDEILAKFLGRSRPRVARPAVDEASEGAGTDEEEEEEEEDDDDEIDDTTGGDVSDAPATSLTTGDEEEGDTDGETGAETEEETED